MFAARLTDMHVCPLVNGIVPHVGGPIIGPGVPNVLIGGLPASVVGDQAICVGPPDTVLMGANNVLVSNRPLSLTISSTLSHGGSKIVMGCFTVMVNNPAGNAASAASAAAAGAAEAASAAAEAAEVMAEVTEAAERLEELQEAGNLSESEQNELAQLNEEYGETIDGLEAGGQL